MKNNQGFTLIELIVVIAIMGIVAGVSTSTMSSVSNQELKDFVNAYDALLSECKVETMSGMPDPGIRIIREEREYRAVFYKTVVTKDDDGNSITTEEIVRKEYLGPISLDVVCTYVDNASAEHTYAGDLSISFDRSTGEIKTSLPAGTQVSLLKYSISNGRKTYHVELIPATGYHRIVQ